MPENFASQGVYSQVVIAINTDDDLGDPAHHLVSDRRPSTINSLATAGIVGLRSLPKQLARHLVHGHKNALTAVGGDVKCVAHDQGRRAFGRDELLAFAPDRATVAYPEAEYRTAQVE